MKEKVLIIFIIFAFSNLYSDPPKKIEAVFSNDTLKIKTIHNTRNPKKHYINRIKISANDSTLIDTTFSYQTDNNSQKSYFILKNQNTNTLFIQAFCNKYGSKIIKLTNTPKKE